MMNPKAKFYIDKLRLKPHPEGGFFREVYRSDEFIRSGFLPARYKSQRSFSTSIYFLLEGRQVSKFHKLNSDELWHFYDGGSIIIYCIDDTGKLAETYLGNSVDKGDSFQVTIARNTWFGAELVDKSSFGLIGCTVAPGFEYADFNLGGRTKLLEKFPQHKDIIIKLA